MSADTVILVPLWHRTHNAEPLVRSLRAVTPPDEATLLFIVSEDDGQCHEVVVDLCGDGVQYLVVPWAGGEPGDYARKINAGVSYTTEPLIFTGADDLCFHPNWLRWAKLRLTPGIGVVGTNDLGNDRVMRGQHSTHSLVTREYVERFGTVDEPGKLYHEGYPHEFTDDEMVQTAQARRAFVHAHDSIVEHMHPHWGKADTDTIYDGADERLRAGRVLFTQRRRLWRNLRTRRSV